MIIENQDFVENNNNKTNNSKKRSLSDKESFGTQLKSARVAVQISIDDIAHSLNLETKIIQAIEEMDSKNLPSTAFVCGYIRSYAKILKLDANQLVQDYLQETSNADKPLQTKTKKSNFTFLANIKPTHIFALIIVIIIAVVSYIKTQETQEEEQNTEQEQINSPTSTNNNAATQQQKSDNNANTNGAIPITRDSDPNVNTNQTIELPTTNNIDIPIVISQDGDDKKTATITPNSPPIEDNQLPSSNNTATTESNNTLLPNPLPSKLTLNISTTDQSWVEIQDRAKKQLYYKLLSKNEEINIDGFYPFAVSIGNASTVSIKINGINFDFKDHIRSSNTAKFNINSINLKKIQEN
jgi:cytoskeleton protein RodZ